MLQYDQRMARKIKKGTNRGELNRKQIVEFIHVNSSITLNINI